MELSKGIVTELVELCTYESKGITMVDTDELIARIKKERKL